MGIEIRSYESDSLEIRTADDGAKTFAGYAIRYDSPSLPLPFIERVAPGAVTRSLKSRNDVRMYVNHDDRAILASTRAKTLRLEDTPDGLWVEADLPDTTYARDLAVSMERRDVTGMSFGFSTVKDSWSENGDQRTLHEIRLHEVSVVTGVPAYPATSASLRSLLIPAHAAGVDEEVLSRAFDLLAAGESLDDESLAALEAVVAAQRAVAAPQGDDDEAADVETSPTTPVVPLSVLRARLDLIERGLRNL
jgi:uncharacterized protein